MLLFYRFRHGWAHGTDDWTYKFYGEVDYNRIPEEHLEDVRVELESPWHWSDKYRGAEVEQVDEPPQEWVLKEIGKSESAIENHVRHIQRMKSLGDSLHARKQNRDEVLYGNLHPIRKPTMTPTKESVTAELRELWSLDWTVNIRPPLKGGEWHWEANAAVWRLAEETSSQYPCSVRVSAIEGRWVSASVCVGAVTVDAETTSLEQTISSLRFRLSRLHSDAEAVLSTFQSGDASRGGENGPPGPYS